MRIRQAVAGTHAGAVRNFNEDAVLRLGRVPLYAIADGMGGPGAGDVAAGIALDVVKRGAAALRDQNLKLAKARIPEHRRALHKMLDTLFNQAGREIREEGARRNVASMGASMVLVTVVDSYAYIAHVGDARAYLFRDGQLKRLTEDHTLAEVKLRRGRITREEYENHPERHVLYQSLGAPFELEVDLNEVRLEHDDIIMLCSDGVVSALADDIIGSGIRPDDLNNSLRDLLRTCIQSRCADNISAVFLGMEADIQVQQAQQEARSEPVTQPQGTQVRGSLFSGFNDEEKAAISPYLEEVEVEAGKRFVNEGDPADALYVVLQGTVQLTHGRVSIGQVTNGVVGEVAFTRDAIQPIAAQAEVPTSLLAVRRARFDELLADQPFLAARLAAAIADAQADLTHSLTDRLSSIEQALRGTR